MSAISQFGLPRLSTYSALVFFRMALEKLFTSPASTKVVSIPFSASVLANRLYVPPYTVAAETMWSPARAMFWMA